MLKETTSISIAELNGSNPIAENDIRNFFQVILANFGEDCTIEGSPAHAKGKLLLNICNERQVTSTEFKQMLHSFATEYEYPTWKPANVLKHLKQPKLHNETWYRNQLNEKNPEDFACFVVNGQKMYCYGYLKEKVRHTKLVQPYQPIKVRKALPKIDNVKFSETGELLSKLTLENNELIRINKILKNKIEDLEADNLRMARRIVSSDENAQKHP